ncbi:hypothetical protein JXB01_04720, partial [Candidatus Micrarchaeota archaeon]|nr:hypothetical protein [Candidatus Micrarchaeota archaeon]
IGSTVNDNTAENNTFDGFQIAYSINDTYTQNYAFGNGRHGFYINNVNLASFTQNKSIIILKMVSMHLRWGTLLPN